MRPPIIPGIDGIYKRGRWHFFVQMWYNPFKQFALKGAFRMIPNIITAIRVLMIFPILTCVAKGQAEPNMFRVAAVLFLFAIMTDMLDGQAARRLNQASTFGAMFDLTADRMLMTPTLLMMSARGVFDGVTHILGPARNLYLVIIIAADVTVIAGLYMYSKLRKKDPSAVFPTPTLIVKATYPAQAAVVFMALMQPPFPPQAVLALMAIAAILTVLAFISYMGKGSYVFKQGLPVVVEDVVKEFQEDVPKQPAQPEKPDEKPPA